MIIDLETYDGPQRIAADLCIAGAGAAGLSIALQYLDSGHSVVVLEGGGMEVESRSQELYEGEIDGLEYSPLDVCRLRYLGGTTNHWGGWCRPLDPLDFESRDWVPYSGWPIGPQDLAPHRATAHEILDLGPVDYDPGALRPKTGRLLDLAPDQLQHRIWRKSPPTNFNEKYHQTLHRADNVRLFLNANLQNIPVSPDGGHCSSFECENYAGRRLQVTAKQFVLALGGLETPRLLLNSTGHNPAGLGNDHDLVGRFFTDHPHVATGLLLLDDPDVMLPYDWNSLTPEGSETRLIVGISPSREAQIAGRLLNHSATVAPLRRMAPGFKALRKLRRDLSDGTYENLGEDLRRIFNDLSGAAGGVYEKFKGDDRPLLGLYTRSEQAPNPDSRVRLNDTRDALGLRRLTMEWRLGAEDARSIRGSHELLAGELARLGLGRVNLPDWLLDGAWDSSNVEPGPHHMGTTRMARLPSAGVVDANCRMHGIDNLYIAGSSVFPTSGFANPTLSIVELALRLAAHLEEALAA